MIETLEELKQLLAGQDAYLVGGAARIHFHKATHRPRDWDVLVVGPLPDLPFAYAANTFGGRKYPYLGLDLWSDDVGLFLRSVPRAQDGIAIHLATGTMLFTEEFWRKLPDFRITSRPTRVK